MTIEIGEKTAILRRSILDNGTPNGARLREVADLIAQYYQLVLKWNDRLHLTTITDPDQFLERHVFEVLASLPLIDPSVRVLWDLGSGLGVPGIPFRLFRPDLEVVLVESNRRKVLFLETVISELSMDRMSVLHRRIEDLSPLGRGVLLTGRAIERMEALFPTILRLGAEASQILLFTTTRPAHALPGAVIHPLPGTLNCCVAELKCSTWNT